MRRDRAGARTRRAPAGSGAARRALAEFELLRDPSASDRAIAKRIKCSTSAVTSIRAHLRAVGWLDRAEKRRRAREARARALG